MHKGKYAITCKLKYAEICTKYAVSNMQEICTKNAYEKYAIHVHNKPYYVIYWNCYIQAYILCYITLIGNKPCYITWIHNCITVYVAFFNFSLFNIYVSCSFGQYLMSLLFNIICYILCYIVVLVCRAEVRCSFITTTVRDDCSGHTLWCDPGHCSGSHYQFSLSVLAFLRSMSCSMSNEQKLCEVKYFNSNLCRMR